MRKRFSFVYRDCESANEEELTSRMNQSSLANKILDPFVCFVVEEHLALWWQKETNKNQFFVRGSQLHIMTKSKSPEVMPQVIPARCACGVVRYVPMFDYESNQGGVPDPASSRQSSRAPPPRSSHEIEEERVQTLAAKEKLLLLQQRVALVEQDYQRVNQYAEHLEREVNYLQNKVEEHQAELKAQRAQQNVSGKPGIASAIVVGQLQSEVASKSQAYAILSARYESQTAQLTEARDELADMQRREEQLRHALDNMHHRSSSASPSAVPSTGNVPVASTDELLQFLEQITKENTMLRRLLVHRDNVLAQLMIGSPHHRRRHPGFDDEDEPSLKRSAQTQNAVHRRGSAYDALQNVDMEELEEAYVSASRHRQRSASAASNQYQTGDISEAHPPSASQSKMHSIHSAIEALTLAASRIQAAVSVGLAARQQGQQNDKDDNILLSEIFVEAKEAVSFGTKAMSLQQQQSAPPSRSVSPQASTAAHLPPLSPPQQHRDPVSHYESNNRPHEALNATAPPSAIADAMREATAWHPCVGAPTASKPLKPALGSSASSGRGGGSRTVTPTPSEAGGDAIHSSSNAALLYQEAEKLRREAERCEKINGELSLQLYCGGTVPLRKKTTSPQRHAMK